MNNEKKLNVLLYYNGTVTDSLCRNFLKSNLLNNIYILNSDKKPKGKIIPIGYAKDIKLGEHKKFLKDYNIDFAFVMYETILMKGIINYYQKINFPAIGVTKKWFYLEASKNYCKEIMLENGIKTPEYTKLYDVEQVNECIKEYGLPLVIKDNCLQGGYGTYICHTEKDCIKRIEIILDKYKKRKIDSPYCLVEKYIKGNEISQHYAWDGKTLLPLLPVVDFKPFSGDKKVINTAGMGSFAPAFLSEKQRKMLDTYNKHLESVFKKLNPDFTGIFLTDLLFTEDDIYTLEFNMRCGVTEFETLIELCDFDILSFCYNLANHQLDKCIIKYKKDLFAGCVVVCSKDLIKRDFKSVEIPLNNLIPSDNDKVIINKNFDFDENNKKIKLNESYRFYSVLNVNKNNPFNTIYDYLKDIKYKDVYYRKDIGSIFEKNRVNN